MEENHQNDLRKTDPISVVGLQVTQDPGFMEHQERNGQESQSAFSRLCSCGRHYSMLMKSLEAHPRWPKISRALALSLFGLLVWGNAYSMIGELAGPEGQLIRIACVCIFAHIAGWFVHFTPLPPLLGMLLVGLTLRNVGFVQLTGPYVRLASILRKMALAVILIRAGVGLDPVALKRLGAMVLKLTIIPALIEAIVVAVMSHYLLNLPWMWGFLLGAVLAAVSPAVVVPCLFSLQDKGYGRKKGIPTLLIAAATLNDIISISAFGVLLSIIFSTGDLTVQIIQGPIGIILGLIGGSFCGYLLHIFPKMSDSHVVSLRTMVLSAEGLLLLIGSETLGFDGAGPLGCINPVEKNFIILWAVFQPILFALIGTEIDLFVLDPTVVGLGVASLLGSLLVRILVSVVVAAGEALNWKEKMFISFAWFPKATVQAAIGPVALDVARKLNSEVDEYYGSIVLMIAVLSILITAPIGAVLITVLGPRLLHRDEKCASETEPIQGTIVTVNP
ncbi:hypothetical protein C0J52_07302 [Blattella germanica]|nr:hypothetical protein C0J52_07302 [Blattella germanica]